MLGSAQDQVLVKSSGGQLSSYFHVSVHKAVHVRQRQSHEYIWQQTHIPILCHFPRPSIERIYYFEILMFRDSIDVYFKSTFSIFLMKPNVPTKIVNVPTDQAGLKSGSGAADPLLPHWLHYWTARSDAHCRKNPDMQKAPCIQY